MSMQRLGTVLVTVDIEKLLNNQIDALSNKPSELYLYNKEALVYQSGETAADFTLPDTRQGYAVQTMNGQKVFVCWLTSGVSGLRLCSVFNYSEIYGQTTRARWTLLLGGCVDQGILESQVRQYVRDALLACPYIREVDGFSFSKKGSRVEDRFTVHTVYEEFTQKTEVSIR